MIRWNENKSEEIVLQILVHATDLFPLLHLLTTFLICHILPFHLTVINYNILGKIIDFRKNIARKFDYHSAESAINYDRTVVVEITADDENTN